jgi:formylglycine-generating enzyme required for sulfatase activity
MMNRQWIRMVLAAAGVMLVAEAALANNLSVTNVTLRDRDDSTAYVQFDISWENSWRYTNVNHDAAWVFFKVLPDGQTDWQHVTLEGTGTNPTDYSIGTGTAIEMIVPTDRVGMFVRRSGEGAGATSVQNVEAVWNFASNSLVKTDKVKLQAFGVEVVFVAEGTNTVGSGGTGTSEFYTYPTATDPYVIGSEDAITVGTAEGNLYYASSGEGGDRGGPIPAAFPKGYAAFYCMKYEITEGQWVDFFNTLTDTQKNTRDITGYPATYLGKNSDLVVNRNTVAWTSGDATTLRPDRVCGFLCCADICAFADWSGLRPMTELEFEKACRGPLTPVADEYAWGTATIMANSRVISGSAEDGTETITSDTSLGGCNYQGSQTGGDNNGAGPLRAGIFATNGATRAAAGASYWGIMELSGNIDERPVTVGNLTGRLFDGQHGNGVLTATGYADVSNWPGTTGIGSGRRGGTYQYGSGNTRVSNRGEAASTQGRYGQLGGRAVRSAPSGVAP